MFDPRLVFVLGVIIITASPASIIRINPWGGFVSDFSLRIVIESGSGSWPIGRREELPSPGSVDPYPSAMIHHGCSGGSCK